MIQPLPSETMTLAQFQKNMEHVIDSVERDNRTFFIQTPDNKNFVLRPLTPEEKKDYEGVRFNDDGTVDVDIAIDTDAYNLITEACAKKGVSFNDFCVAAIKNYVNKSETFDPMFKAAVHFMLQTGITAESLIDFAEAYKQCSEERPNFDEMKWTLIQQAFDEDEAEIESLRQAYDDNNSDAASSSVEEPPF
jgi:hypothetical protein